METERGGHVCIEGAVSSLIYQNPDNGYAVLRVKTEDGLKTVTGCLPGVSPGETLLLTGSWQSHQAYGEQFKAEAFERKLPRGADAIYIYLSSGAIKGLGPAKARDIVDMFGADTLNVMEREPERLAKVRGITVKNALEIGDWFRRQTGLRRLIEFLTPFGIKPHVATRLYRSYGDQSLDAVRENPYIIVGEGIGAEFSDADQIALSLGFESDCPQRVSAAVLFEMSHNLQNGHTFLPRDKLAAATSELIGVQLEDVQDALEALGGNEIVLETVAGVEACYLSYMYEAERYVAERISGMAGTLGVAPDDADRLLRDVQRAQGITYAKMQRKAVELAAKNLVMVLTGGPGTGKTTSVRGILAIFDEIGLKTALCAPTGRAAKRLGELCGKDASTIHRLLGATAGGGDVPEFEHDERNPLIADAVIVDEASMVDILLMRALLAAMKRGCRLVMVGDADQLPSVGPGNVFADIIRSGAVPAVVLTDIFRQAENSGIVRLAHTVNSGQTPDLAARFGDLFFLKRTTAEKLTSTITELISERLPKNMCIDSSQIQVLSPTRRRGAGTVRLNELLREAVNPGSGDKKEKRVGDFIFRVGDKVMQIRNNYDIMWDAPDGQGAGIYNGDVGRITDIDFTDETLTVDFDDKLVTYMFEQLVELEPAFAITVHKSQGSEYRAVILALSPGAPQLLSRGVLYTAITRARELLIIVGDPEALRQMIANDKRLRRFSGLRARLSGG